MRKRVSIVVLIVALIGLAVTATWSFWPAEPEPYNVETYLQRELARLQGTDLWDLPDSEQRIKEALPAQPDNRDLMLAFLAERHRRHLQAHRADVHFEPPLAPAGTNGWETFERAAAAAQEAEKSIGYAPYDTVVDGKPLEEPQLETILSATGPCMRHIAEADKAVHITAPGWGYDITKSPATTATARMLAVRIHALVQSGDRSAALREARTILHAYSTLKMGYTRISILVDVVHWVILLDYVLLKPPWTAVELEELLNAVTLRRAKIRYTLEAEAQYLATALATEWHESAAVEFQEPLVEGLLKNFGFVPLAQLIDLEVRHTEAVLQNRKVAAEWAAAIDGEVLQAYYFRHVESRLDPSERVGLLGHVRDMMQNVAQLTVARLKLEWMRGKRGRDLEFAASQLASGTGCLTSMYEVGEFRFFVTPTHPIAQYGPDEPLATITLKD